MKYSMFIGRWQPWHQGHQWLIDQRLNQGKNVLICIRDVEVNENQPWSSEIIKNNIETVLFDFIKAGRVKVIIIPDIESVNYGRGVGYEVIEHAPPEDIKEISATKIRKQLRDEGKL
jgi:nicotinamide mononucleotide adenylyltransferase